MSTEAVSYQLLAFSQLQKANGEMPRLAKKAPSSVTSGVVKEKQ